VCVGGGGADYGHTKCELLTTHPSGAANVAWEQL
jgi:hypothetical protein